MERIQRRRVVHKREDHTARGAVLCDPLVLIGRTGRKRHVYIFTLNYIAKITIYHFFAVLKNAYSAYPAEYLPIRA